MAGFRHSPKALRYFAKLTDREHAIFEAGIALGSIFHQLVGMPLDMEKVGDVERVISRAFSSQPFRSRVTIRVLKEKIAAGTEEPYSYGVITPESLDVEVVIEYGESKVTAKMRWVEELGYPLMYVEKVE